MNSAPISTTAPLGKPLRPHAPAHARARLEHDHLDAAARKLVGGHEPRQPGPHDDGSHRAAASASTTTTPCSCTSTGFSSSSSRRLSSRISPAAEASRAAAGTSSGGRPRPPLNSGAARSAADRLLHALGRGGQRDHRGVGERLGPDAAGSDDQARHHAVAARGHEKLGAGRRHPLNEHAGVRHAERDQPPVRGARVGLGAHVRGRAPPARPCDEGGPGQLERHAPAELGERGRRIVLAGHKPALHHGQTIGAQELLDLVLGHPPGAVVGHAACRRGRLADRAQPPRVARRLRQRRHAREPSPQARHGGDSRVDEAHRGVLVEQLGQRRGDHHRDGAVLRAQPDPLADRPPRALRRAHVGGLVVEHHHALDRRVLAHGHDDVAQPLHLPPDQRGVVERVADRGGLRKQPAQALARGRRERRQRQAEPLALVGGQSGVASRTGEDGEPAACAAGAPASGTAIAFASSSRS